MERKEVMTATFIICLTIITSIFISTAIILNFLDDKSGNKLTGFAVADLNLKEEAIEEFFEKEIVSKYKLEIIEINESKDLCEIEILGELIRGICEKPKERFILQFLVKNTGDLRIEDLKNSFYCYKTDKSGFWSLLGDASEGAIYDQILNQDPYVAVLGVGDSFIYKLSANPKDVKEEINCDLRFYSIHSPLQLKRRLYLNLTKEIASIDPGEADKNYLNSIIQSINHRDLRKLTNG